jgi:hypothetical protein
MRDSTLACCAAMNPVIRATLAGRIVSDTNGTCTLQNNFAWSGMTNSTGGLFTSSTHNGLSKTEAELKAQSTYANPTPGGLGWDFASVWKMPAGGGYPLLYWQ